MTIATTKPSGRKPRRMAREPGSLASSSSRETKSKTAPAKPKKAKQPSKAATLLAMLQRPEGATIDQMVEAMGWQPHTTRAALTGLKKKGHNVSSQKLDGVRTYRVEAEDAAA